MPVEKAKGFTHDKKDNATVDWYTPSWIFEELGITFDLDPCAPAGGVPWIPAKNSFSMTDDGLKQPWLGCVWLNPPYGVHTPEWLKKMHKHRDGMALLFARTDCKWFHDYCTKADAILFLKGRVSFVDGLGKTGGGGAGCGSMLVAWGPTAVRGLVRMKTKGFAAKGKP